MRVLSQEELKATLEAHKLWLLGEGGSLANLFGADLSRADLSGANLSGAKVLRLGLRAAPPMVLLASWGDVSANLCKELMRYDAVNHPEPEAFNKWVEDSVCPYADVQWIRAVNFQQNVALWSPELLKKLAKPALELVQALLKEKCELV